MSGAPLLEIRGLTISYPSDHGLIEAVRDVDLTLLDGECLGLVGESGSGKSQMLLAILGLSAAQARIRGSIRYRGRELVGANANELNQVRGKHIGMVFQDPMTALNPYMRVGRQITESLRQHRPMRRRDAQHRAIELLESLHLPDASHRMTQYPHELSGGMRQRIMIAMALITQPQILLADEPSTALDVTVQAQILNLFRELRERTGTAIVLVTHDLAVIAQLADRVAVMYAGKIAEQSGVDELFANPQHPYTEGLQYSIPRLDAPRPARLPSIAGVPPRASSLPPGCAFAARCVYRLAVCETTAPALLETSPGHWKACHHQGVLGRLRENLA